MVTHESILSMQICVPSTWTDEEAERFARKTPCGTTGGWRIRKDGDKNLAGERARVKCAGADARHGYVHIMLDC